MYNYLWTPYVYVEPCKYKRWLMVKMYHHMSWTLTFLSLTLILCQAKAIDTSCKFSAIFVFGDSLSDTGNCPRYKNPIDGFVLCDRTRHLPYGKTFPIHDNTFRFSDGRLIIDFLGKLYFVISINWSYVMFTVFVCLNSITWSYDAFNRLKVNNQHIMINTEKNIAMHKVWISIQRN